MTTEHDTGPETATDRENVQSATCPTGPGRPIERVGPVDRS